MWNNVFLKYTLLFFTINIIVVVAFNNYELQKKKFIKIVLEYNQRMYECERLYKIGEELEIASSAGLEDYLNSKKLEFLTVSKFIQTDRWDTFSVFIPHFVKHEQNLSVLKNDSFVCDPNILLKYGFSKNMYKTLANHFAGYSKEANQFVERKERNQFSLIVFFFVSNIFSIGLPLSYILKKKLGITDK